MKLFFDFLQQYGAWLIIQVWRHQLAAEGFGEDGLREFVYEGFGFLVARLDLVSDFEQGLDAADDFFLFFDRCGTPRIPFRLFQDILRSDPDFLGFNNA